MPELPDVERFRRTLQTHAVGQQITEVEVRDPGVVREISTMEFVRQLDGRRFTGADRLGKWLIARTDGPVLLIHFGMTGSLEWESEAGEHLAIDRVIIGLDNGYLVYRDLRKLKGLWLAKDQASVGEIIGDQGPDVLGLSAEHLTARLASRRGRLKTLLMDQRIVAGLGNMLTDEVLWRAKIHPGRRFDELEPADMKRLSESLQRVLRAAVDAGQIPRRAAWISSQRSLPHPGCPRCNASLQMTRFNGRTSYWCPRCQPPPRTTGTGDRPQQEEQIDEF